MSVEFKEVTENTLLYVARNMRITDVVEVDASCGMTPEQVLRKSADSSDYVSALVIDNIPVGIFGIGILTADDGSSCGIPWFLGTIDVKRKQVQFMKAARSVVCHMMELAPILVNYVHADNKGSVSFLSHLGFDIEEPKPWGLKGKQFHRFSMGLHRCVIQ